MKRIYFTVTNDLVYDQRMQRICSSLARSGFDVVLVGRQLRNSAPLPETKYRCHRIGCIFNKGKRFYAEYNTRLFFFLLFKKMDAICAIDLDTILPCLVISRVKGAIRIYDAHEYFTELKEVIRRPAIKKIWSRIADFAVPKFKLGYTVSEGLASEFEKSYGVRYRVIRNLPVLVDRQPQTRQAGYLIYIGAVNEARGLEQLVPAMKSIERRLVICGDGNFMPQLRDLVIANKLENKIELRGMVFPGDLGRICDGASIGVAPAEKEGLNQYLALPNKFFDYIHAGLPQVTMDYPEYRKINDQYEVAHLIPSLDEKELVNAINGLLSDPSLYERLRLNCMQAREEFNWQSEENRLLDFYSSIFKLT